MPPAEVVRYIGMLMDKHLQLEDYVNSICKTARMHLYRIGHIRRLLTREACAQLIHAFVTSRLDSGSALLAGLPKRQLQKLQRVQNSAARLLHLQGNGSTSVLFSCTCTGSRLPSAFDFVWQCTSTNACTRWPQRIWRSCCNTTLPVDP